jgi:hypothetical protein
MTTQTEKKIKIVPERQRLLSRWVMELAASLQDEHDLSKASAMELAHLTRELLQRLGEGRVWFEYRKEDGSIREAVGTLCPGISDKFDSYEMKGDSHGKNRWPCEEFVYWDLEREGFRTFKAHRLLKIKAATIVQKHSSMMH